jgi:predicted enzyme related to lactoylglutathione lyase
MVSSGDESTPGINGGLMQAGGEFRGTINTVEVTDIDSAIAKALEHGGTIALEKQAIPAVGYQAYIKDVSGIIFGHHQADPNATIDAAP